MNTDKRLDIKIHTTAESVEYLEQELTGTILQAAFAVHNTLGAGFLERVYSNALALELETHGLKCAQNEPLQIKYRGTIVGDYIADMIVENRVILELKACASLDPSHSAQLMNYLRATNIRVGLLLNFGRPKLEYRRFVC
ncbi:MAG: GxxExxY protein [Candidatus Acidiferrales bacterium]